MTALKDMKERLKIVSTELSTLAQKSERTADEESTLDTLMAEFNDLGPAIERQHNAEQTAAKATEMYKSAGRLAGIENGAAEKLEGKGKGGQEIDRRGPAQRFAESDELKQFLDRGGRTSGKVKIGGTNPNQPNATYSGGGPVDRYTLIDSGDLPGFMVPPQVLPSIYRGRDYALTARDVLINGRTTSDTIYFLRELLFTNNAAETAEATSFDVTALGSGGRKPESALTFEEASAPVVTIAHWIPITRQALADTAQLQTYIEGRLLVGLERRFNSQVWNGAGGGTNLTGILNTSGVQALDAAAFADDPVTNAGTDNENFERVLRAATEIELTGDAEMTFAARNPRDWEKFRTVTDDNNQYMGGGPFGTAGAGQNLWGYPVVTDRAIPEGTVVAGDGTMAAIWDRMDAEILIDTINDQFVRNMLTILAEMRAALTVFRPAAFAEVELAAW
jgi:HK97 family phage major capsid protein